MQGLHLTADLYDCQGAPNLLVCEQSLAELCRRHTLEAQLTPVGEAWVAFPSTDGQPGGVTGTLLLAESHLAVHTWPELGNVTLDVYVCNFSADNTARAEQLLQRLCDAFQPVQSRIHRLQRGDISSAAVHVAAR